MARYTATASLSMGWCPNCLKLWRPIAHALFASVEKTRPRTVYQQDGSTQRSPASPLQTRKIRSMKDDNFLKENNARHLWHPMGHPGDSLETPPRIITGAQGVYVHER